LSVRDTFDGAAENPPPGPNDVDGAPRLTRCMVAVTIGRCGACARLRRARLWRSTSRIVIYWQAQ